MGYVLAVDRQPVNECAHCVTVTLQAGIHKLASLAVVSWQLGQTATWRSVDQLAAAAQPSCQPTGNVSLLWPMQCKRGSGEKQTELFCHNCPINMVESGRQGHEQQSRTVCCAWGLNCALSFAAKSRPSWPRASPRLAPLPLEDILCNARYSTGAVGLKCVTKCWNDAVFVVFAVMHQGWSTCSQQVSP